MRTFVVFGVGLGNLGASTRKRVEASRWITKLNRLLKAMSAPATVMASYGHTGNFIVQSTAKRKVVCQAMEQALGTSCAALTIGELRALAQTLAELEIPAPSRRVRYTPGAVMRVLGSPIQSAPASTARATYRKFTNSVLIALKHDATTRTGILNRNRRGGGWGAVAVETGQRLGGRWTARSHRTIKGSLRRAVAL